MDKLTKGIAALTVTAGLTLSGLGLSAPSADAAPRNPWHQGLVLKHTERLTNGDWKRYAKSKGAHHLGKLDGHTRCWVIYGPTSYVQCKDGWGTTS